MFKKMNKSIKSQFYLSYSSFLSELLEKHFKKIMKLLTYISNQLYFYKVKNVNKIV
jgi:hypothetical protein